MPEVIHVFSEQDSKGSLLAEVHRLQNSLAAMRQARDFHGANSAELMRERDRLQKEIEMSKLREKAHAPVDAGLIERMMDAARVDKDDWRSYCSDDRSLFIKGMTAALRVAADALLGPVRDWEWEEATMRNSGIKVPNLIMAARRARLLAPAKSLEGK